MQKNGVEKEKMKESVGTTDLDNHAFVSIHKSNSMIKSIIHFQ